MKKNLLLGFSSRVWSWWRWQWWCLSFLLGFFCLFQWWSWLSGSGQNVEYFNQSVSWWFVIDDSSLISVDDDGVHPIMSSSNPDVDLPPILWWWWCCCWKLSMILETWNESSSTIMEVWCRGWGGGAVETRVETGWVGLLTWKAAAAIWCWCGWWCGFCWWFSCVTWCCWRSCSSHVIPPTLIWSLPIDGSPPVVPTSSKLFRNGMKLKWSTPFRCCICSIGL